LLWSLPELPEQTLGKFREAFVKKRSRFPVKPGDIEGVLERWIGGVPHLENFAELPSVKNADRQMRFSDWVKGTTETTTWDESYDAFTDFITVVLEGYLPWLLRAAGAVCGQAGGWCEDVPWRDWANQLEQVAAQDLSAGDASLG
jgi:hypothetical protein